MMSVIAKAYWRTVKRGARTLAHIPEEIRPEVLTLARTDVQNGVLSQEKFRELCPDVEDAT